jgi:hypothetical protein
MTTRIGMEATLQLTIQGPLLIHATEMGPWGVDAIALRDAEGHLVIPSDQIQGKVREALEALEKEVKGFRRSEDLENLVNRDEEASASGDGGAAFRTSQWKNWDAPAKRYPIEFTDFRSLAAFGPPGGNILTQIKMNSDTGATESGMLRVLDAPLLPGQWATFTGSVRYLGDSSTDIKEHLERILSAFQWIPSFGSQKSVGFGRLRQVTCIAQTITSFEHPGRVTFRTNSIESGEEQNETPFEIIVDFTFQDPLCFPEGVANGNIFETRNEIPGEALRGAVAGLLQRIRRNSGSEAATGNPPEGTDDQHPYSDLEKWFSRIRMTTARPVVPMSVPEWPAVIPKSLVIAPAGSSNLLHDVALADEGQLLEQSSNGSPAFSPDWKYRDSLHVAAHFGILFPKKELRVRTAIDSSRRRAKQGQLFAYRTLCPHGIAWRARVTFDRRSKKKSDDNSDNVPGDIPSAAEVEAALSQFVSLLGSGWLSVGKTKARGRGSVVALRPLPRRIEPISLGDKSCFVITLRGPALMIDPRKCIDEQGRLKPLDKIDKLYASYWSEISGGLLEEIPERRFKEDRLIGGFQARKHRYSPHEALDLRSIAELDQRAEKQKSFPYNPTLVVDAGSVFVLRVKSLESKEASASELDQACRLVAEWNAHGLPIPEWAAKAYGDTYHTNIFIPQNGFGEIDVNLPCHLHHTHNNPVARISDD